MLFLLISLLFSPIGFKTGRMLVKLGFEGVRHKARRELIVYGCQENS